MNKIRLNNIVLNEMDLKHLKGSNRENYNSVDRCKCTYYDRARTDNTNLSNGCKCTCLY